LPRQRLPECPVTAHLRGINYAQNG
jgi:hypothetical protein